MSVSADGFVDHPGLGLSWVRVDESLHRRFNEEARASSMSLYGRRMYELMAGYWPTAGDDPTAAEVEREYAAIWAATPKVVFSRTLEAAPHATRLVRGDAAPIVAELKASTEGALDAGGPTLAGSLLAAGLVDEVRLYVHPIVLGAGTRFFPALAAPVEMRLVEELPVGNEVVLLRYAIGG